MAPVFSMETATTIILSFCLGWVANDAIKNWWRKHQFFKQLEEEERKLKKWLNN